MIKTDGEITPMGNTGFVRDQKCDKGRMDLLPWNAILELSKHCEEGAKKYGEHNIDRGAPFHSLLDSGMRHLAKYYLNQTDESHLKAACWNLMFLLEQTITHPELNDLYYHKKIWSDNEAEWWESEHDKNGWHSPQDKTPDEGETLVYVLNGKNGNISYEYGFHASDDNVFEEGNYYIDGMLMPEVEIVAWHDLNSIFSDYFKSEVFYKTTPKVYG